MLIKQPKRLDFKSLAVLHRIYMLVYLFYLIQLFHLTHKFHPISPDFYLITINKIGVVIIVTFWLKLFCAKLSSFG